MYFKKYMHNNVSFCKKKFYNPSHFCWKLFYTHIFLFGNPYPQTSAFHKTSCLNKRVSCENHLRTLGAVENVSLSRVVIKYSKLRRSEVENYRIWCKYIKIYLNKNGHFMVTKQRNMYNM